MKRAVLTLVLSLMAGAANAALIGLWGGSQLSDEITDSGNSFVTVSASSSLADLQALDQVWLIRSNGDQDLIDYVFGGGTLVTEWDAATWALNTASLLDATDSYGCGGCRDDVTFTAQGVGLGFGTNLPNPYFNGPATEFFSALFTNPGCGCRRDSTV